MGVRQINRLLTHSPYKLTTTLLNNKYIYIYRERSETLPSTRQGPALPNSMPAPSSGFQQPAADHNCFASGWSTISFAVRLPTFPTVDGSRWSRALPLDPRFQTSFSHGNMSLAGPSCKFLSLQRSGSETAKHGSAHPSFLPVLDRSSGL